MQTSSWPAPTTRRSASTSSPKVRRARRYASGWGFPRGSGSCPGSRLRSANSGAIISSMACRSALAVASKKRRARALLFSCSEDTAASSSFFFLPTGVHLPRDGNIYDPTRVGQSH
jgi:hypothetical protein